MNFTIHSLMTNLDTLISRKVKLEPDTDSPRLLTGSYSSYESAYTTCGIVFLFLSKCSGDCTLSIYIPENPNIVDKYEKLGVLVYTLKQSNSYRPLIIPILEKGKWHVKGPHVKYIKRVISKINLAVDELRVNDIREKEERTLKIKRDRMREESDKRNKDLEILNKFNTRHSLPSEPIKHESTDRSLFSKLEDRIGGIWCSIILLNIVYGSLLLNFFLVPVAAVLVGEGEHPYRLYVLVLAILNMLLSFTIVLSEKRINKYINQYIPK